MNIAFPPPLRWQDFEELTVQVFRAVFDDPTPQAHGRPGQSQHGVDVFGREMGSGRLIGVQCKKKSPTEDVAGNTLSLAEIHDETSRAQAFGPEKLDYLIMATTGQRDAGIQRQVAYENAERTAGGMFPIGLWFWEDYVGFLNNDASLQKWYAVLLNSLYGEHLADIQILTVMRTAFSRAAFQTPLRGETAGEFRQALLDTCRAVNTGLLLDRETRMPICRAPAGLDGVQVDPLHSVPKIVRAVRAARLSFDDALANRTIEAAGSCLIIHDIATCTRIDGFRARAIRDLNALLESHGIDVVDSPLLATIPPTTNDDDIDDFLNTSPECAAVAVDSQADAAIPPSMNDHDIGDAEAPSGECGAVATAYSACRLELVIRAAAAKWQELAARKRVHLRVSYNDNEGLRLMMDAESLKDAIGEIIENAVKYAYENTDLDVMLERRQNGIAIVVQDVGMAVPREHLEHFGGWRASIRPKQTRATGLFMARQVIASHRGSLKIESRALEPVLSRGDTVSPHTVRVTVFLPYDGSSN